MNAFAYCTLTGLVFWVVLAILAPKLAAWLLIGGMVGLALVGVFSAYLRDPDAGSR